MFECLNQMSELGFVGFFGFCFLGGGFGSSDRTQQTILQYFKPPVGFWCLKCFLIKNDFGREFYVALAYRLLGFRERNEWWEKRLRVSWYSLMPVRDRVPKGN